MTPVTSADDPSAHGSLRLRVMGVTVDSRMPDEDTRARLAHQWSRAVLAEDAETGDVVEGPPAAAAKPDGLDRRDYYYTTQITLAGLQATTGERVNLHAGTVADDDGRVLVIVGPSGTGKTTATLALATRLHYMSDETASITPDGVVHAHPKPLSIVIDAEDLRHKRQLSPDDLGLGSTPDTGTLHRIVLLHRGVPSPRGLQPLGTVDALMELIEQSSSLGTLATPLPTLLAVADASGGVLCLEYDEITDHVDTLVHLLDEVVEPVDRSDETTHGPRPVHHPGPQEELPNVEDGDTRVRRLSWTDALEIGPDVVVLAENRAVRLGELAATLWLHLAQPRPLDDLVAWAQEVHGSHPGATEIVNEAISALVRERLVADPFDDMIGP